MNELPPVSLPLAIQFLQASTTFGGDFKFGPVDLEVREQEFFCLIGPSGSGKTTLLGLVGGWIALKSGGISLFDEDMTSVEPHKRPIRACFQKGGYLFPHMSVGENVGYALKLHGRPKHEIIASVEDSLGEVGLAGFGNRSIANLSGGEIQRVSIARALTDPKPILLLDEVTAGLDRPLRSMILAMLEKLVAARRLTVVCVTHDAEEAFRLCNRFKSRLAVLKEGKLEQLGTPETIYAEPNSSFVASLVGDVNLLPILKSDTNGVLLEGGLSIQPMPNTPPNARWLALRPEAIQLQKPLTTPFAEFPASVEYVESIGPMARLQVRVNGVSLRLLATQRDLLPRAGHTCPIFLDLSRARFLDR